MSARRKVCRSANSSPSCDPFGMVLKHCLSDEIFIAFCHVLFLHLSPSYYALCNMLYWLLALDLHAAFFDVGGTLWHF